ncbi:NAD(P)/FAD-dependent oxidoreductase [Acidicapsa dinghuensis]|uniref:NAD(P)/FAD-dependent oxidoreductase n=1 Tax=Acidicapsa dinghuensis TaxID=2218256 RepID=A0ABW1EIQ7_9BACT|nr:NAD(P)/FAD-dependent oxidoreductase [Acidicapsa dinghuensis]
MPDNKCGAAIIIGAGPAGLTAALELQRQTAIKPILIEASHAIGGISRTIVYKGNRMDIGGHRFFSKSDRVMQWWLDLMPVEASAADKSELRHQGKIREVPQFTSAPDPNSDDLVMLVRQRKSRIYFLRCFFDYPIKLTADTLRKMGGIRTVRCGFSYLWSAVLPQREEHSLEDFLINRFGRQLYLTFFKSYTEKVWGVPCDKISAEWGAQRIKGLSLKAVAVHFLKKTFSRKKANDIAQKQVETSLIEKFLYPKLGPGQLWEHVADIVRENGGEIHFGLKVDRIRVENDRVVAIEAIDEAGQRTTWTGDYFFSTMPVRDLIRAIGSPVPSPVREISEGLLYRDFITVGLLANKLIVKEADGSALKDNWIYIQESDVTVGRLQIFNNWSPWLVANPNKTWIGLEYFCNDTDPLWKLSDEEMGKLAIEEVSRIGILKAEDVEDYHVVRVAKTYPAYFGSYDCFDIIRNYTDTFKNLFLVGRNGMHKYNNQDHSMLTAMTAVENIVNGITSKDNIWSINTEMEYHEDKAEAKQA